MSKICRSGSWIAAAVMAAGLMGGQVYGADELDQQLGPKDQTMGPPAPTTAPKVNATEKPVTPKVEVRTDTVKAPSENDIVSPDAVKKVDDADLVKDLTGENKGQASADPAVKFKEAIERMGTSEERLKGKDTGEVTQETQRRIVMDLDVLIEIAKKQQQQSSSSSQGSKPGQKKQLSQGQSKGQGQGGTTAAERSELPGAGDTTASSNGADIHEKSREWGNLPPIDRDAITKGANEQYLPAYRDYIDRYYQALAELSKANREK